MRRDPRPAPRRSERRLATELTFGLRAALAVLEVRPEAIVAVHVDPSAARDADPLLRWATANGRAVTRHDPRSLARLAGSELHEGLCVEAQARDWASPSSLPKLLQRNGIAIALDRVRNPYNVGAVLRSAAFFGVEVALLGAQAPHPALAPLAVRVAEGGAERVALSRSTDLAETLGRLRASGVRVIGAEAGGALRHTELVVDAPSVIVMGNEREGLSERVRERCDARVAIVGTGAVESLNVGVAAGVLIAAATSGRAPRR